MYELIQVAEHSYYMDCPTKVGFYLIDHNEAVLFDSGSDKDAAKKVKKILDQQGWNVNAIYNTHSHADHIGGNQYLQSQTNCEIFVPGMERAFTEFPLLEPLMLYGGDVPEELKNKFLMAKASHARALTQDLLPDGVEMIPLPGHCCDMVGYRTKENVVYLADCLSSEETLAKYKLGFIYDVKAYMDTLEKVKCMEADCFVPSHAAQTSNIAGLAQINIDITKEIAETIKGLAANPVTFDDLLAAVFNKYALTMNFQQRMLVGSTVKSYLTYLKRMGEIEILFSDNRMLWGIVS